MWFTACAVFVQVHLPSYRHAQVQRKLRWSCVHTTPARPAAAGVYSANMHNQPVQLLFRYIWLVPCSCSGPVTKWNQRAHTQPRRVQRGRRLCTKILSPCLTKEKWVGVHRWRVGYVGTLAQCTTQPHNGHLQYWFSRGWVRVYCTVCAYFHHYTNVVSTHVAICQSV